MQQPQSQVPRGPADAGRDLKPERGQDHGQGVSANSRVKMKNKVGQKTPDNMDGQDADVPSSHQDNYALDNEDMSNNYDENAIAATSIDQICKYSHKILRKYVVNGMIDLVDGPQLHNLVDARDYRIICIMEVFSQNKNEDDFLENLGLLSQVMKEGDRQDVEEQKAGGDVLDSDFSENDQTTEDPEDSFVVDVKQSLADGFLTQDIALYCIDRHKSNANDRKLTMTHNVFKRSKDLKDFGNSLKRIYLQREKK